MWKHPCSHILCCNLKWWKFYGGLTLTRLTTLWCLRCLFSRISFFQSKISWKLTLKEIVASDCRRSYIGTLLTPRIRTIRSYWINSALKLCWDPIKPLPVRIKEPEGVAIKHELVDHEIKWERAQVVHKKDYGSLHNIKSQHCQRI